MTHHSGCRAQEECQRTCTLSPGPAARMLVLTAPAGDTHGCCTCLPDAYKHTGYPHTPRRCRHTDSILKESQLPQGFQGSGRKTDGGAGRCSATGMCVFSPPWMEEGRGWVPRRESSAAFERGPARAWQVFLWGQGRGSGVVGRLEMALYRPQPSRSCGPFLEVHHLGNGGEGAGLKGKKALEMDRLVRSLGRA